MTRFAVALFLIGLGLFFSVPEMIESVFGRELIDETTVPQPLKFLGAIMVIAGVFRLMDFNLNDTSGGEEDTHKASSAEGKSQD